MHVVTKMFQQTLSLLILLSSLIFSTLSVSTQDSNIYVQCSQLNFTSNTPYESNVNSLFTSLTDSASLCNFNKFQTSTLLDDVIVIYGLFQCRGDLTSPNCKDCVANAVSQLQTTCPMSTGGVIQLEGCFVKFDNKAFFGAQENTEVSKRCGPSMGYSLDVSNRIDGAMANLVGDNGQYFREGDFGNIEGVAQCVQDLSLSDCQDCLSEASGQLRSECETSTSGDMYFGKCYVRYANQGNGILVVNNGTSRSDKSHGEYIATWMSGVSAVFTFVFGSLCCSACLFKRKNIEKDIEKRIVNTVKAVNVVTTNTRNHPMEIDEEVEQVKKPVKDQKKKPECHHYEQPMIMPPPCQYYSAYSNPNACYYSTYSNPNECYYL